MLATATPKRSEELMPPGPLQPGSGAADALDPSLGAGQISPCHSDSWHLGKKHQHTELCCTWSSAIGLLQSAGRKLAYLALETPGRTGREGATADEQLGELGMASMERFSSQCLLHVF